MSLVTVAIQRTPDHAKFRVVITHNDDEEIKGFLIRDCKSFDEAHQVSQAAVLKGRASFHDDIIDNWVNICPTGCCFRNAFNAVDQMVKA